MGSWPDKGLIILLDADSRESSYWIIYYFVETFRSLSFYEAKRTYVRLATVKA